MISEYSRMMQLYCSSSGEWTVTILSKLGGAPGTKFYPEMMVWVVEGKT